MLTYLFCSGKKYPRFGDAAAEEDTMYDITTTHFRDIYGKFLWAEPIQEDFRLYNLGEEFVLDAVKYRVERMALAENTQHVNIVVVYEDLIITEPCL